MECGAVRRPISSALVTFLLLTPALAACAPKGDSGAAQAVRLYQDLPVARANSALVENEGEGEAIALINAGTTKHTVKGWMIQTNQGKVILPRLELEPGQVIYLANDAGYFKKYWNKTPDYEYGVDADPAVPDLKVVDKVPVLNDRGDLVRLLDEKGTVVDMLAYGAVGEAPAPWSGLPVALASAFPLTPENQVITRRRQGDVLLLEPKAESWSGGSGERPERVYFAGQSNLPVRKVSGPMTLTAASAPDNAHPLLFQLVDGAEKSIRLAGSRFDSADLADRLIAAARRGVRVTVALQRNPGGSEPGSFDKEIHRMLHEGGVEVLYVHPWDGEGSTRYAPYQAAYAIIDDETALVAAGGWTGAASSPGGACGSREWMAVIQGGPEVVNLFKEVWEFDFMAGHPEVRAYKPELDGPSQPGAYAPEPCPPYSPVKPQPLAVTGNVTLTRILSPDNSLDREQGFLGLIRGAKQELLISAATIEAQAYREEIVAAARRGVAVKLLLDGRPGTFLANQQAVQHLNDMAAREKWQLEARLVNVGPSGMGPWHQGQGLIVDGAVVIASSDGTEASFRTARATAIKFEGLPAFTDYYRDLFMAGWQAAGERPAEASR